MRNPIAATGLLLAAVLVLCAPSAAGEEGGVDWVMLVDSTGSMRYQERGEKTVEGIDEFVSLTRSGDRLSVVGYGEWAALAIPRCPVSITDDASREYVRANTDLRFVADRTDITAGLEYVWDQKSSLFPGLDSSGGSQRDAVVVLLTDGKLIPVYDDFDHYEQIYRTSLKRLLELASLCREHRIRVCTIALGPEEKVDGELMRTIAERTGGTYRHVASAPDVVEAYREIAAEQRPVVQEQPALATEPRAEEPVGRGGSLHGLQDLASASDRPEGPSDAGDLAERARPSSSSAITAFPSDFCLGSAGVLAMFIGLVAVGTEKRQKWAGRFFSANLFGTGERRVRGYLKPIDPPGTNSARANIGLENPGLASLKIGTGTQFIPQVDAEVEFLGTTDGSPPSIHVESGCVLVEGVASSTRKLKDGDVIEIDGLRYQYLRGNRR